MTRRSPTKGSAPSQGQIEIDAAVWVSRRLGGRPEAYAEDEFARWLADDPRHAAAYEDLAATWQNPDLWTAVSAEADRPVPRAWPLRRLAVGGGLAAVAAVAVWWVLTPVWADKPYAAAWRTGAGEWRSVALPDGSVLRLNGRTAASAAFTKSARALRLEEGELLVDVAHGNAPFTVWVGDVEARALGTRYNVDRHAAFVDIAVLEGVVEVRRGAVSRRVPAGQSVRVGATIEALDQPADALAVWTDGWVETAGMPLAALAEELSRFSPRPIRIEGAALARREVSGRFALTTPEETLAALAVVYGAEIEVGAEAIVLRPKS